MIEINTARLINCGVPPEICKDGSVRLVKYNAVKMPEEAVTMQKVRTWDGEEYHLKVHNPLQRTVALVVTVARTSTNYYQVTASSLESSGVFVHHTLSEVNATLLKLFKL